MKLDLLDLGRVEYDEGFRSSPAPSARCRIRTRNRLGGRWRSSQRHVKTLADRTDATLVFGHDADVLAELGREKVYD